MATKKKPTPKPQPVTFFRPKTWWRPAGIRNENATRSHMLEDLAIYDNAGVICWLNSCDLGDKLKDKSVTVSLPIVWNVRKEPDYTEARAHIVSRDSFGERKYTLFIPVESVTMTATTKSISKACQQVRQDYAVEGIPAKFNALSYHPFERYAMLHELESLQKEQYHVLTGNDITTPYARKRIAEFFAKIEAYTAEAERIEALTPEEYEAECNASGARFNWSGNDGAFRQVAEEA